MAFQNRRTVQHRTDGQWEVRADNAQRASAVASTQQEAITRARKILKNDGGGELQIRSLKGRIRESDTIKPANDPRTSRG